MRVTRLLLICMCCIMIVPAVWGQAANGPGKSGILGFLDPHTGAFRPVPSAGAEGPEALTTFTGTINVTLTITLKTTAITNVTCSEEVSVIDAITSSPRFFAEGDSVAATGTGTTRTCTLSIPYSWALATQPNDTMSTSYVVAGTKGTGLPTRSSTLSPLDTRSVPANGTTTTLTAAVTL